MINTNYNTEKKGFVLSLVLWITAAIMLLALLFVRTTKEETQIYKKLQQKLQLDLQVESLFETLSFYLSTGKFSSVSVSNHVLDLPKNIRLDATDYNLSTKSSICHFSLLDHSAFFNVHFLTTPFEAEKYINAHTKQTYPFFDLYMDWIDKDNKTRLNGAEKNDYMLDNYGYTPPNANIFQNLGEITMLKNFNKIDHNTSKHFLRHFTTYGTVPINIQLLNKDQLKAFLPTFTENELEHILLIRKTDPKKFYQLFKKSSSSNPDNYSMFLAKIVTLKITCKANKIQSSLKAIVDYKASNNRSWIVLEIYK